MKIVKHRFSPITQASLVAIDDIRQTVDDGEATAFAIAVYLKDGTMMVANDGDSAQNLWLIEALREDLLDQQLRE